LSIKKNEFKFFKKLKEIEHLGMRMEFCVFFQKVKKSEQINHLNGAGLLSKMASNYIKRHFTLLNSSIPVIFYIEKNAFFHCVKFPIFLKLLLVLGESKLLSGSSNIPSTFSRLFEYFFVFTKVVCYDSKWKRKHHYANNGAE
jgi:hypothetical protein